MNGTHEQPTSQTDSPKITQRQIQAALAKRPRFKLDDYVPPHVYKAVGFIITLERDGIDRAYAIGIASNMFKVSKEQFRELMDQADGIQSDDAELADMIRDFHAHNERWSRLDESWRNDQWEIIMEIKRRLNEMLEHLGEARFD